MTSNWRVQRFVFRTAPATLGVACPSSERCRRASDGAALLPRGAPRHCARGRQSSVVSTPWRLMKP